MGYREMEDRVSRDGGFSVEKVGDKSGSGYREMEDGLVPRKSGMRTIRGIEKDGKRMTRGDGMLVRSRPWSGQAISWRMDR